MIFPCWNEMDDGQRLTYMRRLELEQKEWEVHKEMSKILGGCKHVIIKGRILYSPAQGKVVWTHEGRTDDWNGGSFGASCAVCFKQFGWWCPKNPKGYCEYDGDGEWCIHCKNPTERK